MVRHFVRVSVNVSGHVSVKSSLQQGKRLLLHESVEVNTFFDRCVGWIQKKVWALNGIP